MKQAGPINGLISKYTILAMMRKTSLLFSRSFFVLYLLTILDYQLLGVVFAAAYLFEAFTDYPSGVLSDKFGYRKILFFAFALYGASYILLGLALTPYDLIGVVIIQALANGQDSGALQSWFDNNYEKLGTQDQNRVQYLQFMNKNTVIVDLVAFASGVGGGYLAYTLQDGRRTVFFIQAVMMIYLALVFLITLENYYVPAKDEGESYLKSLFGGLGFVFLNPKIFLLTLGLTTVLIAKSLWIALLMIPIYNGYVGNDFYLSILNFAIFGLASIYVIARSKSWKNKNISTRLPLVKFAHALIFFIPLYFLLVYYPPTNTIQLYPLIAILLLGTFSSAYLTFDKVLTYRLLLDIVPNDKRNGFYSFLPTFSLIFASILNYYAGSYIHQHGVQNVILGLMGIEILGAILVTIAIGLGLEKMKRTPTFSDDIPYIFDNGLDSALDAVEQIRPSPNYIGETAKRIWLSMTSVAKGDENVTDEELDLLVYSMERMQEYLQKFEFAYADGVITQQEFKDLEKTREKIKLQVTKFAEKSDGISKDEKAILKKIDQIFEELKRFEKFGNYKANGA